MGCLVGCLCFQALSVAKPENTCMHLPIYTYIYIYNHTYFHIYPCKLQTMSSHQYLSFQSNTTGLILVSSLSLPRQCETWLPLPLRTYLINPSTYNQSAISTATPWNHRHHHRYMVTPPSCGGSACPCWATLLSLCRLWPTLGNHSSCPAPIPADTHLIRPHSSAEGRIVEEEGLNWILS